MPETAEHAGAAADALYPSVRTPLALGRLRLPHRVVMGSMHLNHEHGPADALAAFYGERARGGAGLIITGGAAVSRVGAGNAGYTLINEPEHAERWRPVVDAVHAEGALIALQLFHAGRYAFESSFGLRPVAPSAVYSTFSRAEPEALGEAGIRSTIADFASAAAVAVELGFDAVEIMGSEGYLINEFASPVTNLRDDAWGGDAERRRAFPLAVLAAVRAAVGAVVPVIVRMSGADLVPGSSTPDEVDALAVALARAGADAIDVGVGWHEAKVPTVQSMVPHGAWVDVAARVKGALAAAGESVPVIASNRINTLAQAERVLASGAADLVSMARPFLADARIIASSFAGRPELVNTCIGCNEACIDRTFGLEPVSCTVNPRAGRELEFPAAERVEEARSAVSKPRRAERVEEARSAVSKPRRAERVEEARSAVSKPRRAERVEEARSAVSKPSDQVSRRGSAAPQPALAVIGAGPAGMEAARAAATAGARVTLFEGADRIGGQFLMAGAVPGKSDFLETVRYFERELARLGVELRLGERVHNAAGLAGFDDVIVSTGVLPRRLELPGIASPHVIDYAQAFADPASVGRRVAILGAGGIAVDLAHLLVEPSETDASDEARRARFLVTNGIEAGRLQEGDRNVTVMRRAGAIGAGMGITTRWAAVQAIRRGGVRTLTGVAYLGIEPGGVRITHDGVEQLIAADTVIVAAGQEPHAPLSAVLAEAGIRHTVIGGALDATGLNAVRAFEHGLRAGTAIARGAA
ncbi:FAD-dependent oxidoreductase [Microbacterium sp. STN6]|uniref:oxidoreductase n=1 Tax=Microbacterium sp. STN6 TaxID=2995588 RepID=UPI002260E7B1|nr:FAD-dependent oxidoreductase [Microbacterium sp. STN6]MCX7523023.1 FAD-dependent oxidoreductase [Microbacterium sp. STN6]